VRDFFAVFLTGGFWLLAIPLYPKRCIVCGELAHSQGTFSWQEVFESEDFKVRPGVWVTCLGLIIGAVMVLPLLNKLKERSTHFVLPHEQVASLSPSEENLLQVAGHGDTYALQVLLGKGANPNAKDRFGYIALMFAARNGHLPVVQTLLEKGADPTAKNVVGETALDIARKEGHTQIESLLQQAKTKVIRTRKGSEVK
jgi:hypothetical protein